MTTKRQVLLWVLAREYGARQTACHQGADILQWQNCQRGKCIGRDTKKWVQLVEGQCACGQGQAPRRHRLAGT